MRDYSELKKFAQAATGFTDVSLAPDVVLELIAENERLRAGMKGDYDLDAWLDWSREAAVLRKDADRYQWLRDKSEAVHQFYLSVPLWFTGVRFRAQDVDKSIDAMSKGEQS